MIEDGNKFSWERNNLVLEDNFEKVTCSSHLRDKRESLLEEDGKPKQHYRSTSWGSDKIQVFEIGHHKSNYRIINEGIYVPIHKIEPNFNIVIAQNDTSLPVITFPWFCRMSTFPWRHFMKVIESHWKDTYLGGPIYWVP